MHMVTRWCVLEWLENSKGEISLKEILERCPSSSMEEVLSGIEEYLKGLLQ